MCPLIISRVVLLEVHVYRMSTTLNTTPPNTKLEATELRLNPSFPKGKVTGLGTVVVEEKAAPYPYL